MDSGLYPIKGLLQLSAGTGKVETDKLPVAEGGTRAEYDFGLLLKKGTGVIQAKSGAVNPGEVGTFCVTCGQAGHGGYPPFRVIPVTPQVISKGVFPAGTGSVIGFFQGKAIERGPAAEEAIPTGLISSPQLRVRYDGKADRNAGNIADRSIAADSNGSLQSIVTGGKKGDMSAVQRQFTVDFIGDERRNGAAPNRD